MIPLACQCGRSLRIDESLMGRQVRCPACEAILQVPGTPIGDTGSIASFDLRTHDSLDGSHRSVLAGSAIRPDQKFSHYLIKRRLGAGAMGEVWLAFDTALERELAIKILPPSLAEDQERLLRFFREARLAAQLNHPNAVTIYQVGVEEGLPYLAMELVDGGSLEDQVRRDGPLDWPEATHVIRDAAAGLAEAHALGLVHRDVKPANLLKSTKGITKVADFGLARATSQQSSLTSAGAPLGTPAYMPPEQWKGDAVDGRSDLYSLACTYYFLLTGKPPFEAPSAPALGYQHSHVPFPDARQLVPQLPSAVCRILERGAQKEPAERHPTAAAFVAELDALLAATAGGMSQLRSVLPIARPPAAAPESAPATSPLPVHTASPPRDRRKHLTAVAGIAGVLLFGVIIYITSQGRATKFEVDDPDAVVRVERPIDAEPSAEPPADADDIEATHAGVEHPLSFDDAAPPPQPPVWIEGIEAREPIPDMARVEQAEATIREHLKQRLEEGKLPDAGALAQEMLDLAAAPVHQPAERFAHLRLARTAAIDARDMATALKACDQMKVHFDVDHIRMKAVTLVKSVAASKIGEGQHAAIAQQCFLLGFESIAREDYRYVQSLVDLARVASQGFKLKFRSAQAGFLAREAAAGKVGYEAIEPLAERLRQQPQDAEANAAVGAFLCLVKNEWKRGLPMLERGDDPQLVALAKQEKAKPTALEEQVALGDAWWRQATGDGPEPPANADGMRVRARYWYLKGLSQATGSERTELARRVQPRIDAVPVAPVVLHIRMKHCDGPHVLEITADGIETKSNRHGTHTVHINHLDWNRAVHGHVNAGASRLYPSAVDFSTAALDREWHGRWGWISFRIAPDRFVLHQGHGPTGATDFDVVLVFESSGFTLANRFEGLWETKFFTWNRQDWDTADGIHKAAGWEKLAASEPVETLWLDQLNFRSDAEPYGTRFKPLSDKVTHDFYAIVATSKWRVPAGDYELSTMSDDGVRVYVDDKKLIDNWDNHYNEFDRASIKLSQGEHRLRVEYYQFDRGARLQLYVRRVNGN